MKKFFFLTVVACVALAGCVKNEPAPFESEQQITFAAPVVGLNTKAVNEVWNNYPTDAAYDFAVWGYYYAGGTYTTFDDGQRYMNNVTVSYDGDLSGWAPATPYYWPKNGSLTFIAYSPATLKATEDITVTKAGIQIDGYNVDVDATKQVDLLFSERAYNKKSVDDYTPGSGETDKDPYVTDYRYAGVHLSFKHALSSILFTARTKGTYTGTTITLKEISLLNIKSKGTFKQTLKDANGETTAANAELWSGQNEPKNYVISGLNQVLDANAYYPSTNGKGGPAVEGGLRKSDFILLPQKFEIYDPIPTIQVKYTIESPDSYPIEQVQEVSLRALAAEDGGEWKWGHRYIYNIIIALDKIYFEPYVTPWTDAGYNITL